MAACVGLVLALTSDCASEGPCQRNSDCTNAYCSNGVCKKDCLDASRDCPAGYVCNVNAQCALPGDGGLPPDGGGGDSGGNDASTDTGGGGDDAPADVTVQDGGDGGALKSELDLCTQDSECEKSLICRGMYVGGASRCTRKCSSNSQCMTGTRCETIGNDTFCAMSDAGRACSGASQCNFGCLTGPGYCTVACVTGSDCPNGYGCMSVSNVRVCVKAEAYCQQNQTAACIAPAACDQTVEVVSGCTLACNGASDCPQRAIGLASWTCDGLCRRPPDVVGPLGQGEPAMYACNLQQQVVNVCNDSQHMDFTQFTIPNPPQVSCSNPNATQGVAGDVCVDSCRFQGGCIHGFACTALGSLGANSRIGLCLPSLGGGEVGANCSKDADCFFGYCIRNQGKCSRDCSADGVCPSGSQCNAAGGPQVEGLAFKRCE